MKKFFLFFGFFLIIFSFAFRSLLFSITTNLFDWNDYPVYVWIIFQNIYKIREFQLETFFNTNAFYPFSNTLLFSDTFLPQALIGLPFTMITNNPILIFNIIFIITFILNYLSSYLFWKQIFKKELLAFTGALFVIFNPFFHLELSHFQMMSYWPFFFALYFLFKEDKNQKVKKMILVGIFLSIQFLASVYLSIYLIFTILFYFLVRLINSNVKFILTKNLLIIFLTFIVLDGIFIKSYIDMKNYYQIHRDLGELVTYSAHLSDYIFTKNINSIFHHSGIMAKWNSFNHNFVGGQASFPGFLLFFLSIFGLFKFTINKHLFSVKLSLKKETVFFVILLITGFIFSLGPRLNFNGAYAYIPAPYNFVVKFLPFIEAARAPSRWSFLFYIAIIYFSLVFINKLQTKKRFKYIITGIILLFLFEYVPINIQTHHETYIDGHYQLLKDICSKQKRTVLEIPVTHLDVYPTIGEGVSYISKVELSSNYHQCYLINGYSGYDMPSIFSMSSKLNQSMANYDWENFISELKRNQVDIIKVNVEFLHPDLRKSAIYLLENGSNQMNLSKIDNQMFYVN
jgi:hypothetical protein